MPLHIKKPIQIKACGNKPKIIREYIGRVNSETEEISIAHMTSPAGWIEPGQTPKFNEYTIVLKGAVHVKHKKGQMTIKAGQAIITNAGEWVQYSTPKGADYIAVCVPAFSPQTVRREV